MGRVEFSPLADGLADALGDELNGRLEALKDGVNESLPAPRPWTSVTQFLTNDVGSYQGQLWFAKRNNVGVVPVEGADWTLLVARGQQGPQGTTGATGAQGPAGAQGPQGGAGATGPAGATGATGANGATGAGGTNGTNGATWRSGAAAPSNATGADGDFYLNTTSGDVYKRVSGAYNITGNIRGPQGVAGPQGAAGPQGPAGSITRKVVTVATTTVRVAMTGKTYLIGCDFSSLGQFGDACYTPRLTCDEAKVITLEQHNQKSAGKCFFTIYVPSDAPAGNYGDAQDLQLDLILAGFGWNGVGTSGAGAWDALAMVL